MFFCEIRTPEIYPPRCCRILKTDGFFQLTVYTLIVYTSRVSDKIRAFEWNAANVGHILRHGVSPFEVEEVSRRPHITIPAGTIKGEKR